METGRLTSHDLVVQYLTRIALYENRLHAVITTNLNVLAEADERDRERAAGRVRGPLHCVPIALKDNILTHDIVTTGGALTFDGYMPPYDATLVKNLRDAGAVIIAKTTLSGVLLRSCQSSYEPLPSDTTSRESAATGGPTTRTPGAPFGTGAGFGRPVRSAMHDGPSGGPAGPSASPICRTRRRLKPGRSACQDRSDRCTEAARRDYRCSRCDSQHFDE